MKGTRTASGMLQACLQCAGSEHAVALATTLMLHVLVALLLFSGWQKTQLPEPKEKTIKVQMLVQRMPAQPARVMMQQPAVLDKPQPQSQQAAKPVALPHSASDAQFAYKRVDEMNKASEPEQVTEVPLASVETPEKISTLKSSENIAESKAKPSTDLASAPSSEKNFDVSQYVPVSKEAPSYPQRALDKGIQGACTVQYTVNTQGLVENAEALSDCHPFFIKPSLEATKSFRYTPRMIDGKPVKVSNIKNTFQYRIQ